VSPAGGKSAASVRTAVIPRLDPLASVDPSVGLFAAELRRSGYRGQIGTDHATRLSAATDNSIYQVLPAAVLFPRTTADVALALKLLEGGSVTVQPGVVLDDLNALEPHGVYFAPSLSPSNRATIGGMIATDASGEGSRVHGKTARKGRRRAPSTWSNSAPTTRPV